MNTIMEEKIKRAFQEWKQAEQPKQEPIEQPKETIMQAQTQSSNRNLSTILINKIEDTPGITGKELRAHAENTMPGVIASHVPAILKGFFDSGAVNRLESRLNTAPGRSTFAYTFVPENQRVRRVKSKGSTKRVSKTKIKPTRGYTSAAAPISTPIPVPQSKGIATLVPTEPLNVGPTTLHITIATSQGSYSLRLDEAKFIYQQLNQIFGGAR